jgi:hypothetical protein
VNSAKEIRCVLPSSWSKPNTSQPSASSTENNGVNLGRRSYAARDSSHRCW